MLKKVAFIFFVSTLLTACKSGKNISSTDLNSTLSAKKIIENNQNVKPKFNTLASRVQVTYEDEKTSQSMTVSLRIEKNETIWVSASILGITIAKLLITPEKVQFYEISDRTYFDGDFSLLSHWLGVSVNFDMVQNILLGDAVIPLKYNDYISSTQDGMYMLTPKNKHLLFSHLFFINPVSFKLASQEIKQENEQQYFSVTYSNHQVVQGKQFPKTVQINALNKEDKVRISLDYRNIDVNARVSFPFSIPSGYTEITFD